MKGRGGGGKKQRKVRKRRREGREGCQDEGIEEGFERER